MSEEKIEIKKTTMWKAATVIMGILLLGMVIPFGGTEPEQVEPQPYVPPVAKVAPTIDNDAIKGDTDAPVTIIEFSDYECPFCGRFYSQTEPQIKTQYIETGKVRLIYRDYPLSFHPQAQKAAEAAECAGEQDKYYAMHDFLFENGVEGGVETFKKYAEAINLDMDAFNTCLNSGAMASEVAKDFADGNAAGVRGTPTFFINGKLISGAQPFNVFQQAIDGELN